MAKRVLITGMSGLIGGLLKDHLLDVGGYELTALNRRVVEGVPTVQADIADLDAIRPRFRGPGGRRSPRGLLGFAGLGEPARRNVVGTYNVFEAAREAGVRRVVFASSGNSIRGSSGFRRTRTSRRATTTRFPRLSQDNARAGQARGYLRRGQGLGRGAGQALLRCPRHEHDLRPHRVGHQRKQAARGQGQRYLPEPPGHRDAPPRLHRSAGRPQVRHILRCVEQPLELP